MTVQPTRCSKDVEVEGRAKANRDRLAAAKARKVANRPAADRAPTPAVTPPAQPRTIMPGLDIDPPKTEIPLSAS